MISFDTFFLFVEKTLMCKIHGWMDLNSWNERRKKNDARPTRIQKDYNFRNVIQTECHKTSITFRLAAACRRRKRSKCPNTCKSKTRIKLKRINHRKCNIIINARNEKLMFDSFFNICERACVFFFLARSFFFFHRSQQMYVSVVLSHFSSKKYFPVHFVCEKYQW